MSAYEHGAKKQMKVVTLREMKVIILRMCVFPVTIHGYGSWTISRSLNQEMWVFKVEMLG